MKPELVLDINWSCDCPEERTDNLPPCGQGLLFKRPDGYYCLCGHDTNCCKKYKIQDAFNKKYGRKLSTHLQPTG